MSFYQYKKVFALATAVLLTGFGLALSGQMGKVANPSGQAMDHIKIVKPWARATPRGAKVGAAYLEIHTTSAETDRLVAAASPVAGRVEIHTHSMVDGVMKMRKIDGLDVSKAQPARLAPGGDHIMLFELKQPLEVGGTLPLTLTFKRAGQHTVTATIAAIGAQGPSGEKTHGAPSKDVRADDRGSVSEHHGH